MHGGAQSPEWYFNAAPKSGMGGMVTWSIFEHCIQDIAFYLPVSGDSWALGGNQRTLYNGLPKMF